jgi:hypothetical protein
MLKCTLVATDGTARVISKGSNLSLENMPGKLAYGMSLRETRHISLIGVNEYAKFSVKLICGVSCDRLMSLTAIDSPLTKAKAVYLPEPWYISSDPLPDAWFEHFEEYKGLKGDSSELFYHPSLTGPDIAAMQP